MGHVHLRHLNPLPKNLGELLKRYRQRAGARAQHGPAASGCCAREYLVDTVSYPKVQGKPFKQAEIEAKVDELLER